MFLNSLVCLIQCRGFYVNEKVKSINNLTDVLFSVLVINILIILVVSCYMYKVVTFML